MFFCKAVDSLSLFLIFSPLIEIISLDVRICYVESTASLLVSSLYRTDTPGAVSTASINVFFVFF